MRDRLGAFWRRTLAYNRQPRKLAMLPFTLAVGGIAVYMTVTGSRSLTLIGVMVGLVIFVQAVDALWWLALRVFRPGSPNQF